MLWVLTSCEWVTCNNLTSHTASTVHVSYSLAFVRLQKLMLCNIFYYTNIWKLEKLWLVLGKYLTILLRLSNHSMHGAIANKWCFQETVVSRMQINTCELSHHGQKSTTDHFKSSITHINFNKTISRLFQPQYNFNSTDITIHDYNSLQMTCLF